MHSPARLTLPLMVQSGEGATDPDADASRIVLAFSTGLAAPRMAVFLLRARQSQGAMKAPCHIPALASRAATPQVQRSPALLRQSWSTEGASIPPRRMRLLPIWI